jgi:hypothetical protein
MAYAWLIALAILVLLAWILFKILKKALKVAITLGIIFFVSVLVLSFLVMWDAKSFVLDSKEKGIIYLYQEDSAVKAGIFQKGNEDAVAVNESELSKPYKDLIDKKARIIIFSKDAFSKVNISPVKIDTRQGEITASRDDLIKLLGSPDYMERVNAFGTLVRESVEADPTFVFMGYKKGSINVYPSSPLFVFVSNVPMIFVKPLIKG